jgi:murein tripeptide amidase MpaA/translation initiation factor 2 beta subunit (eIF-2beta)/eIF-5
MRKVTTMFMALLFILLYSTSAYSQDNVSINKNYRLVTDSIIENLNGEELGQLYAGTVVEVKNINDLRAEIQFNHSTAFISIENLEREENNDILGTSEEIGETIIFLPTDGSLNIYSDKETSKLSGVIYKNAYYLKSINETTYSTIIGNKRFYIKKDSINRNTIDEEQETISKETDAAVESNDTSGEQTTDTDLDESANTNPLGDDSSKESTGNSEILGDDNSEEVKETAGEGVKNDTIQEENAPDKESDANQDAQISKTQKAYDFSNNLFKVTTRTAVYIKADGKLLNKGSLEKGKIFKRLSDYGDWHEVRFGSTTAYINKSYTVPATFEEVEKSEISDSYNGQNTTFSTQQNVRVYGEASTSSELLGRILENTKYTIDSETNGWLLINFAGRMGYVEKSDVEVSIPSHVNFFKPTTRTAIYIKENGKLIRAGAVEEGEVYPRLSDYGDWHQIKFGDITGFVKEKYTIPILDSSEINNLNENYSDSINKVMPNKNIAVYDNSSGKLKQYASIYEGMKYPIISDIGDWFRIDLSGRVGYIRESDVKQILNEQTKFFSPVERTAIYIKVNGSLERAGAVETGEIYPRVVDYGDWHQVRFGDDVGYVKEKYTQAIFNAGSVKNLNSNLKNSVLNVTPDKNIAVYDNTSGKLVQFGSLYEGIKYPIISDIGAWLKVDVLGRIGYVRESDVKKLFTDDIKYFQPTTRTALYIKQDGKLIRAGAVDENQVYSRIQDYGDWHQVEFGNSVAYVNEDFSEPALSPAYNNKSPYTSKGIINVRVNKNIAVYDNTSGKLVQFGSIYKGQNFPIVGDIGDWLKVDFLGRIGYIKEEYSDRIIKDLVNPNQVYTYKEMQRDIKNLVLQYSDILRKEVIGKSVDKRDIYALKLGTGKTEIMINGSHHAREHITTNILMEMIDQYAMHYMKDQTFDGYNVRNVLNSTSLWFVPMVNPDGVTLNQLGAGSAKNPEYVLKLNGGSRDFSSWKANVRGVDLNRQYPTGWSINRGTTKPSPQDYKGSSPLSEPESKALYDFTMKKDFKTAVAYHSSGAMIYWSYRLSDPELMEKNKYIANMLSDETGYRLLAPSPEPIGAYDDWFIDQFKRPAFTPEVSPYVGPRPVPLRNYPTIWRENKAVGLMLAQEAYKNRNKR